MSMPESSMAIVNVDPEDAPTLGVGMETIAAATPQPNTAAASRRRRPGRVGRVPVPTLIWSISFNCHSRVRLRDQSLQSLPAWM
ncbi:hypothetical protein Raf01_34680 [Rugosimonospora africana]|uniref:Uncharacterized protein n=1 Tax=Rugosimonospora africana TaxID=556532 RepID=A0A8J3VR86_9ACTN|nr:hypothetical protein Raf01_34680 [Rugosimonospora africana]